MHPLEAFCCQHFPCSDYGQRGVGNLRWHGWSSKKNQLSTRQQEPAAVPEVSPFVVEVFKDIV